MSLPSPHRPRPVHWRSLALGLFLLATAIASCSSDSGDRAGDGDAAPVTTEPAAELVVRKDVRSLTDAEKADFVAAIKELKASPAPTGSLAGNWYDHFVAEHVAKLVCWTDEPGQGGYGHNGPDLLTWHRAYLREFEEALSTVAGKPMALPYWDWSDPDSTEVVFAEDFMGPLGEAADGYAVTSGPFRQGEWVLHVKGFESSNPGQFDHIVRAAGTMGSLPEPGDVQDALDRPEYDVAPWGVTADDDQSFRAFVDGNIGATGTTCDGGAISIEGTTDARLHGGVHMWVGGMTDDGDPGALADTLTSPNDPVFWLHHTNIDRLAESWWTIHGYTYAPDGDGPRGSNRDDLMWPYDEVTNGDVVRPTAELGYAYDQLIERSEGGASGDDTSGSTAPEASTHTTHEG